MNQIVIVGNLSREPELRYTPGGQSKVEFGVASNEGYKNKDTGEWVDKATFHNVVQWRQPGENAAASLVKGCSVVVIGSLEIRQYEASNGEKKQRVEINARVVAVDLTKATAIIERNERSDRSTAGQSQRSSAPNFDDETEPF